MSQVTITARHTDATHTGDPSERTALSPSDATACSAVLWVHGHFETGNPIQIDPVEWNGRVDLLNYVTNEKNLGEISIEVPTEDWIHARIEYEIDEGQYCSVRILPNAQVEARRP